MSETNLVLTADQSKALAQIQGFVERETSRVLILSGFAGTGKTTLMRELVDWLFASERRFVMLASTGRAAKVLSDKVGANRKATSAPDPETANTVDVTRFAQTIHHYIYKFIGFNKDINKMLKEIEANDNVDNTGQLLLQFGKQDAKTEEPSMLYIVDEASMVSDLKEPNPRQAIFGSGRLLKDLLDINPQGKFIFVGDQCQLPPVGQSDSPALSQSYLYENFGIEAEEVRLTEIVRQAKDNDIILAADRVRKLYEDPPAVRWGKLPLRNYKDIELVDSSKTLLDSYIADVRRAGYTAATLLCTTNRLCNQHAKTIRPALGFTDTTLMEGELLLVTQNNLPSNLRNGDLVRVVALGQRERRAGLTFLRVEVMEIASRQLFSLLLIEDILYSGYSNLDQSAQKRLFIDFHIRMRERDIKQRSQEYEEQMFRDPYLNALRAVYGYALTCHKAQGGEWPHVYVSIPRNFTLEAKAAAYQWLYTAMTRASERLYLVDEFYIEGYNSVSLDNPNIVAIL